MKTALPRWMQERLDGRKQAEAQLKALRKKANAAKRTATKRKKVIPNDSDENGKKECKATYSLF